jgi:hypothetical protein
MDIEGYLNEKSHPMKKTDKFSLLIISVAVLTLLVISGCEKKTADNSKKLLGTWISTDLTDTIEFRTEHDLYKSVGIPWDHFDYSVSGDSITIHYNGVMFILVKPSNHYYTFNGNTLTIDLRNCYGFRSQIITFNRKIVSFIPD